LLLAGAVLFCNLAFAWHPESKLVLSRDEAEWRRSHPIIRVGVFAGDHMPFEAWRGGQPDGMAVDYARMLAGRAGMQLEFHPYADWNSFNNNVGTFDGIAADYLRILHKDLDLKLQYVPAKDWTDLQRMVIAGQVDVIVAGTSNDFGPDVMRFSQPYEYFPEVIVTRLRGPTVVSATGSREAVDPDNT